jgi:translation initiation factor 3 subunit B
MRITINYLSFSDIDTDELDSDTKNVEEEVVEFFIKEEVTVIE